MDAPLCIWEEVGLRFKIGGGGLKLKRVPRVVARYLLVALFQIGDLRIGQRFQHGRHLWFIAAPS